MRLENEKSKNTFLCAINGILKALKTERNLRFDLFVALIVIIAGFVFKINLGEWVICLLSIALMLFAELINTAIETVVDMYTREKNALAGRAKDIAAGAVLMMAINVAIVGLIIFVPKLLTALSKL